MYNLRGVQLDHDEKFEGSLKSHGAESLSDDSDIPDIHELDSLKDVMAQKKPPSLKEISDRIMEIAKKATASKHCYVAYVDPENGDSVGVSFSHMTGECEAYKEMGEARFPVRKDGTYGGLLGYSLDTGKAFYVKNPASHPAAHGMPKGHVEVEQFLSVPVMHEGNILGQIVLGNPEKDYNDRHLQIAGKIADVYGSLLNRILY